MELYELSYFVAIWNAKSVSGAAELVHVSQPALSQCIRKMEGELNAPLFERPMQKMQLTKIGEIVYSYGKEILKLKSNMDGAISEIIHADDSQISIGMSPFYSKYYLPSIITEIRKQFPNIRIKMVEDISSNLEKMLLSGEVDFCCVPQAPGVPGIAYEPICIEEILLAVPSDSPLTQKAIPASPIPFLDVKYINGQKFVALKQVQKINSLLNPLCHELGINYDVVYETLDWDTVNIMIANGIGIGFVPDILCMSSNAEIKPCYYRIPNQNFMRYYSIAYKENKALTQLERHLISIFKTSIEEFRKTHILFN